MGKLGSFARLPVILLCTALVACGTPGPKQAGLSREEQDLRKQSQAFNRTLVEATVAGAVLGGTIGYTIGGREKTGQGIVIGAAAGLAAGSYVANLQKKYANDEARLEQLRKDIDRANNEAEAALANMRRVRDQQLRELAEARASNDADRIREETQQANANREEMDKLIEGAEGQYAEFRSTRSLALVEGQETGIDPQLAILRDRIDAMRRISETLVADI